VGGTFVLTKRHHEEATSRKNLAWSLTESDETRGDEFFPHVQVIDLDQGGEIRVHKDDEKFFGAFTCGLNLLTDSTMRFERPVLRPMLRNADGEKANAEGSQTNDEACEKTTDVGATNAAATSYAENSQTNQTLLGPQTLLKKRNVSLENDAEKKSVLLVPLPRRSVYVMSGSSRWKWLHGVEKNMRGRRLSMIVRDVGQVPPSAPQWRHLLHGLFPNLDPKWI